MQLQRISINEFLGIKSYELKLRGKIFEVAGENATGKTSFIEAIMAAAGGGNVAHMLRKGASEGDVVLEFDTGHTLRMAMKDGQTTRTVRTNDSKIMRVQDWLKARLNPMSFNPVSFINADAADRLEMLLKVCPLSLDRNELIHVIGEEWIPDDVGQDFTFEDPIKLIDRVRKSIFDNRTGLNRTIRDKDGQIAELRKSLPPEGEASDDDSVKIDEALKRQRSELQARKDAIDKSFGDDRLKIDAESRAAEINEQRRHEMELKNIAADKQNKTDVIATRQREAHDLLATEFGPEIEALKEKAGAFKARRDEQVRADNTRKLINKVLDERAAQNQESIDNTVALDKLEELRRSLLEKLPLPNLQIKDGQLFYDEILFDTVNDAQKWDIALHIAASAAGELKIICVDGLEKMTLKNRKHFIDWASKSGAQFFYCLVRDDQPLTVTDRTPEEIASETESWP